MPPKDDWWNPRYYAEEAKPLLRKLQLWRRLRTPVWLGLPLLAWLIVRLLSQ
jgi:hypothetical protein